MRLNETYYGDMIMVGRDKLYEYLKSKHGPNSFSSRDDIGWWLNHQEINQLFYKQSKPKNQTSMNQKMKLFQALSIDLLDMSNKPSMQNNKIMKYVLVIVENVSRYMWAYAMPNKDGTTTARFMKTFLQKMKDEHRSIKFIQSDEGPEFQTRYAEVLAEFKIKNVHSIPGQPQTNSIVERANGTLKRLLGKMVFLQDNVNKTQNWYNWTKYLDKGVDMYNNTVNRSIKMRPMRAVTLPDLTNLDLNVKKAQKAANTALKPPYELGIKVRKRILRSSLGKASDPAWSSDTYTITRLIIPRIPNRPVKYEITGDNYTYFREMLLPVPVGGEELNVEEDGKIDNSKNDFKKKHPELFSTKEVLTAKTANKKGVTTRGKTNDKKKVEELSLRRSQRKANGSGTILVGGTVFNFRQDALDNVLLVQNLLHHIEH